MEKKRSMGVEIAGFLIILISLYKIMLGLNFNLFSLLFQPLPDKIIMMHYFISLTILILLLISGVGILFSKNIFRKVVLFIASYTLLSYLIEGPLFYFRNISKLIEQTAIEITSKTPNIPASIFSSISWVIIILFVVIDFAFAIWLVYFFTRHETPL